MNIKRAHFKAARELYVELPKESCINMATHVGKLVRSLHGTQDASRNWELEIRRVMVDELGFSQGRSSPCLHWHETHNMQCNVHRDHFAILAAQIDLTWFVSSLEKHWWLSVRAVLGPPGTLDTVQEAML